LFRNVSYFLPDAADDEVLNFRNILTGAASGVKKPEMVV